MTCAEYMVTVFETYRLVSVLADKHGCRTLRLRHRERQQDIVLHQLNRPSAAYTALCGISCRNLPAVYDTVELSDGTIVWEEWLDGMTVAEVMESGRYHRRGAKKVMRAVCDALTVLHERGIIHRDVKPENVIVDSDGRVVLIDFNISCDVADEEDSAVMGTVGYTPPEQLGLSRNDARTDIYAAGVLLNVMLTGQHPCRVAAGGKLGRVVRRCTMTDPNDRYQTAAKLRRAL